MSQGEWSLDLAVKYVFRKIQGNGNDKQFTYSHFTCCLLLQKLLSNWLAEISLTMLWVSNLQDSLTHNFSLYYYQYVNSSLSRSSIKTGICLLNNNIGDT